MKRALALAAVTAAALFAAVSPASADTAAPTGSTTLQQQVTVDLPDTPMGGDTSWGGACETPLCKPWN
ncbi:hypothetical protein ACIHEI_01370 [Kitasatospora sp. NPDC051984]|uniref:hypothetical protein n=1 Tax=Kitasatospora sp. NPDC051984 TaxID=3364059 RepID=UPI0037C77E52